MTEGAGLTTLPVEPMVLHCGRPPWSPGGGGVRFVVDLPTATRRTAPSDKRREAVLCAIEQLPPTDVTIWSDESARGGTADGGAGALVQLHNLRREEQIGAPTGGVCSSLRAKLMAIGAELSVAAGLDAGEREQSRRIYLITDSKSGLQLLRQDPSAQTSALAAEVLRLLHELESNGHTPIFQWVPGSV